MYDPIYVRCPEEGIHKARKSREAARDLGERRESDCLAGTGLPSGMTKMIWNKRVVMAATML